MDAPDEHRATAGDQAAGDGGWNVGAVVMDGGTVAFLAAAAVAIVWMAIVGRRRQAALETVVANSMAQPDGWKRRVEAQATARKAESELHRTVRRMKAKAWSAKFDP